MLAVHGVFGLFSILFLWTWIIKRYRCQKELFFKAMFAAFAVSGVFFMFHAATRMALPGFLIGFLGVKFNESESS